MKRPYLLILVFFYLAMPLMVGAADCECEIDSEDRNKSKALPLKLAAIFSILVAGGIGVCLPTLSKVVPALQPKASSSSSSPSPPGDTVHRTHTHTPRRLRKLDLPLPRRRPVTEIPVRHRLFQQVARQQGSARGRRGEGGGAEEEEERSAGAHGDNNGHVHTHATHGSTALTTTTSQEETRSGVDLVRHRVVSQAKFKVRSIATMALFFSLTTLVGIVVGIEISSSYNENSLTALIVEGRLNSVAVGILIYMALVDLLATNFMNPIVQNNGRLQLGVNISLLLGAGLMSLLAKWA